MEFRVLGPVEIHVGGSRFDVGYARQRALLAVLLLELGRVVPAERLIDRVWGEDPPPSVRNALYGNVARLRAVIAAAGSPGTSLTRQAGGYMLQAAPGSVDVVEFRQLVTQAGAAGDDEHSADLLAHALALWRGTALTGVRSPWLDRVRQGLDQERRAAELDLYDVGLRLGRHAILVSELMEAAAATPADERLAGLLMLALYRCGRPAEALRCFERTRRRLADELGADPGPALCHVHEQVLRNDPSLEWRAAAGPGPVTAQADPSPAVSRELPVPRQLPADVAAFTGRAGELVELDRLMTPAADECGTGPVVISAVSGTAGVGKTALAVHWGHQASARFPDGQLYVNLRGYDPDQPLAAKDALAGLLRSVGVAGEDIPPDEDGRAALYRSVLAGRRALVLLDNARDVAQVRPLLPGSPGCRVLVTSRDSLAGLVARDGAKRLDLDLLPEPDAVGLLRAVIGSRVEQDPQAAVLLAERCARLPLALRVAGELAVARPGLPLAELASELAGEQLRLELLDAGGDPRTAVRAVFSWSRSQLDQATAAGFALLGLHPGPDLEPYAAAALTGTTPADARRLLETLARAHLIQSAPAGPTRYAIHDLLRAYARELVAAEGKEGQRAALTRLLDHLLQAAAAAMDTLYPAERHNRPEVPPSAAAAPSVDSPETARAWLDDQLASLAAAAGYAATHGWPSHAVRLSAVLYRYLDVAGHYAEAATLNGHAIRGAREAGDLAAEAVALLNLSIVEMRQSRFRSAEERNRQVLTLSREIGDRGLQARALANLGIIDWQQSRYEDSTSHNQQALTLYRETGNPTGEARTLLHLGAVARLLGRHQPAIDCHHQALTIFGEIGHRPGQSQALAALAEAELSQGDHLLAARHFRQCLALCHEGGERRKSASALDGLGRIEFLRGRYPQAGALLERALELHCEFGDRSGEIAVRNRLGELLLAQGQTNRSLSEHSAALRVARQIGDRYEQARALDGLGSICQATGDHDQARHYWNEALAIFADIGVPRADQVRAHLAALAGQHQPAPRFTG